jgi:hypothetical protein
LFTAGGWGVARSSFHDVIDLVVVKIYGSFWLQYEFLCAKWCQPRSTRIYLKVVAHCCLLETNAKETPQN